MIPRAQLLALQRLPPLILQLANDALKLRVERFQLRNSRLAPPLPAVQRSRGRLLTHKQPQAHVVLGIELALVLQLVPLQCASALVATEQRQGCRCQ